MPDQNRNNLGDDPAGARRGNDERKNPYPYGGERDPAGAGDGDPSGGLTPVEPVSHGEPPHGSSYGDRDPAARDANGDDGVSRPHSSAQGSSPGRSQTDPQSGRRGGRSTTGPSA